MKKFIYISAVLMLVISFSAVARAEENTAEVEGGVKAGIKMGGWFNSLREIRVDNREEIGGMRDERKEMMEENKAELREGQEAIKNASPEERAALIAAQKEKRAGFKDEFVAKTKEIIEARVHFAAMLYQMTVARLEQIADRIDSRIEKLVADGKDMDDAKEFVAEARVHIEKAQTAAAEIKLKLESLEDKSGFFEENKEKIAEIRSELKLAHESLAKAIQSIKLSVRAEASVEVDD